MVKERLTTTRFTRYAWGVLAYNVAVILWGAYVRATGSGAGCGSHWPLCDGVVIPRSPRVETVIEFSHRASSGLALLLVAGLFFWAFRAYPRGHRVRRGATYAAFFVVTEALVGAGLVLFKLVADNPSLTRVFSTSVHLVNTFLLLAVLTLTAWWASDGPDVRLRGQGGRARLLGLGLLLVLLLGMTGAVTALGDTLFPPASLGEGLRRDLDPTGNFLEQLRVVHPLVAVVTGFYLFVIAGLPTVTGDHSDSKRFAKLLMLLFGLQIAAGVLNVLLLAPIWMQQIHLFLADLTWIGLVLLAASAMAVREPQVFERAEGRGQEGQGAVVLESS
jgi:heme A synthase